MRSARGFTLIELVITMAIFATLAGISTISLFGLQNKSKLTAAVSTFTADLKSQQLRAMVGDSGGGGSASDFGLRLHANSYTLFRDTYGTNNNSFDLPEGVEFSAPDYEIVFQKGSGEIAGGPASVIIRDTLGNNQKTVQLNRYGIIIGVN